MADVGTWNPEQSVTLDEPVMARLCGADAELDAPALGFAPDEVSRYAPIMRLAAAVWAEKALTLPVERIESLIRVLTVAEMKLPGWEANARSPVVPLVAELKRRGAYEKALTTWIKAHTTNRFLPHGNLMDRL